MQALKGDRSAGGRHSDERSLEGIRRARHGNVPDLHSPGQQGSDLVYTRGVSQKLSSPAPRRSNHRPSRYEDGSVQLSISLTTDQDVVKTPEESEFPPPQRREWKVLKTYHKVQQSLNNDGDDCPFCSSEVRALSTHLAAVPSVWYHCANCYWTCAENGFAKLQFARMDFGITALVRGGQECKYCGKSKNKTSRQAAGILKDRYKESTLFSNSIRVRSAIQELKGEAHKATAKKMEEERNERPGYQYMQKLAQAKQKQREEADARAAKFYAEQVAKGIITPIAMDDLLPPLTPEKERSKVDNQHPKFGRRLKSAAPGATNNNLHSDEFLPCLHQPSLEIGDLTGSKPPQLCSPISRRRVPAADAAEEIPYTFGRVGSSRHLGASIDGPNRRGV